MLMLTLSTRQRIEIEAPSGIVTIRWFADKKQVGIEAPKTWPIRRIAST